MTAELMVYALIAAGLVFWLRSILGTRNEDEPQQPPQHLELSDDGKIVGLGGVVETVDRMKKVAEDIDALRQEAKGNMSIASGGSADKVLLDIAAQDRDFDVSVFLQASQDAFVYIVEAFAEGDRESLQDLLGAEVYQAFDEAIHLREEAGETRVSEIQSIQKSEIIEARLEQKNAYVTVRFLADEVSVSRDSEGNIIQGHPEQVSQMRDVWTFSRDVKSKDPRWFVVETREDGVEDNETIPNTH